MIAMPVCRDVVVDLCQPCIPGGLENTSGIACRIRSAITGVNEHRFARGRDEECCVTTLHIDDVDVERLARLRRQ